MKISGLYEGAFLPYPDLYRLCLCLKKEKKQIKARSILLHGIYSINPIWSRAMNNKL